MKYIKPEEECNRTLMAVGAHADDIEFNVGGTLLKYHALGYGVDYVMSTNNMSGQFRTKNPDGTLNRTNPPWDLMMPTRKREAAEAAALVGTTPVHLDHPQRHYYNHQGERVELRYGSERPGEIGPETPTILTAHQDRTAVERLANLILERNPEAIFVHGMVMTDMEHVGTCLLTTKAYWLAEERGYQGMLLHWPDATVSTFGDAYQQWASHVDITSYWKGKMDWIRVHASVVLAPEECEYAPREAASGCGKVEVFDIVSRGCKRMQETPFRTEVISNARR